MVVFSGACTRCEQWFQWDGLSHELSCLEAKNKGVFGDCRKGIQMEEHSFDQECDGCTELDMDDDEGVGGRDGGPGPGDQALKADGRGGAAGRGRDRKGKNKRERTS